MFTDLLLILVLFNIIVPNKNDPRCSFFATGLSTHIVILSAGHFTQFRHREMLSKKSSRENCKWFVSYSIATFVIEHNERYGMKNVGYKSPCSYILNNISQCWNYICKLQQKLSPVT